MTGRVVPHAARLTACAAVGSRVARTRFGESLSATGMCGAGGAEFLGAMDCIFITRSTTAMNETYTRLALPAKHRGGGQARYHCAGPAHRSLCAVKGRRRTHMQCGVVGAMQCDVVLPWCGAVRCGAVWRGVVWCYYYYGAVWCGVGSLRLWSKPTSFASPRMAYVLPE